MLDFFFFNHFRVKIHEVGTEGEEEGGSMEKSKFKG